MKKLFALLLTLLMLCSCGAEEEPVIEEPQSEEEVSESSEAETENKAEINITGEISYKGENGKIGIHKNGNPVTEPVFDEIIECEREFNGKKIYEVLVTDGKRKEFVADPKKGPYLMDFPNTLHYLFDENGNQINEKPLSEYYIMEPYSFGNGTYDWFVEGTYEGDYYLYSVKKDGTYYLHTKYSAGTDSIMGNSLGEELIQTEYYWGTNSHKYGVTDMEGNVILDNLYLRIDNTGRNDLMYAYVGWSFQTADEVRVEIYDFDGNLISDEYNYIQRIMQEDGYFLVANCFGENAGEVCYDENGNPYEAGYWFVDDRGNKLSERFEHIEVERFMPEKGGLWQVEKVIVTDENGKEKEIPYEPYKIYYE